MPNSNPPFQERFANWYISFVCKNKFKSLALYVCFALICLFPIIVYPGLKLDADLSKLLPDSTPSVIALKESYTRFGSTDRFMIAIQSENVELVEQLQYEIRDYIQKRWTGDYVSIQIDNDNKFFKDNALLYLPIEHLERIRDNLEDVQLEIGRKNLPFVVDLVQSDPKKKRIWFDANIPQELGLPDEAAGAFDSFFKSEKNDTVETQGPPAWDPKAPVPERLKTKFIGCPRPDSTGKILFNGTVQAKLTLPSTDYAFVAHILARSDTLLQYFSKKYHDSPVRFSVEGTYEGLKEVEDLQNDSITSFAISLALIIAITIWFFRSVKGPFLVIATVLYACLPMLAFTAIFYGTLNPFTVFVATIILGIGIDYSIHMLGTTQKFLEHSNLEGALKESQKEMFKPFLLASGTTIAAFLTLLFANFRGFYEFGVVASLGVLFSMITSFLILPVFAICSGGIPHAPKNSFLPAAWDESRCFKFFKHCAIITAILIVILLFFAPYAEFEHNLNNLRRDSTKQTAEKGISAGVTMSSGRKSSQPAAVMGSKPEQLDKLYDTLMILLHKEKAPNLRSFLTLKTFVPPQDAQKERLEIIEEIREFSAARVFDKASGEDSTNIVALRNLAQIDKTFTAEDIPAWALDLLREKDGTYGKIGFIYGRYPSWDAHAVHKFQQDYSNWNFDGEKLRVFSSQFILSDVIDSVKQDSFKLAISITVIIFLTLVISLRKPSLFASGFLSFASGILFSIGLMGFLTHFFDFGKIGIYNVIVIPMVLGLGIDFTVHIIMKWTNSDVGIRELLDTTGRNVMASATTTAAGFVGMLFTAHKGLKSIGDLACMGIMVFLISGIIFSIFLCATLLKKRAATPEQKTHK